MRLKHFSVIALLALATFGCSGNSPAPTTTANPPSQSATPVAVTSATPISQSAREAKPFEAIKLTFRKGEEESTVEIPGLMVQVTNHEDDFFRFDYFATAENIQKVAESRGLTASYDAEAKALAVGEQTFEQTEVPPIGEGMDGSLAGFGSEGVETYLQDGTPYFRISSVSKGFGSNSISKTGDGLSIGIPE